MKFVFVDPRLGNNYGVLTYYQLVLMEALERHGHSTLLLSSGRDEFMKDFIRQLAEPDTVFYAGMFFFDMRINAHNHYSNTSLFDACHVPVIGRLGDHAFASFMTERLENIPRSAQMWADTPSLIEEIRFLFGSADQYQLTKEFCSLPERVVPQLLPHDARPIDVLVPLTLIPRTIETFLDELRAVSVSPVFENIATNLYEALCSSHGMLPPLSVFLHVLKQHGVSDFMSLDPNMRSGLLHILHHLDEVVRQRKRRDLLDSLADIPPNLNVVVTGTEDHFSRTMPPNVKFIGRQSYDSVVNLLAQSRMAVNSVPSFPESIHERVLNASALGCASVSDFSVRLGAECVHGETILFVPSDGNLASVCAAADANLTEHVGIQAKTLVAERFNVDIHVEQVLGRLRAENGLAL
ncbi:hypothetical protein [Magnetospirillum sp. 15-1]|uniref:glycosyltransferase family protein n=1 Tax=Magnetospirillum sp. 15-1 TaxID=1979370 RepID=UPI000BBBC528|nr:hypothetical protein [Magnetospirillum sp. 15-1]